MCVDQSHALFPVGIRFRIAGNIGVKDKVHGVRQVIHGPHSLSAVEVGRFSPCVRVEVMNEADPVAVHEPRKFTVAFSLVLKWRVLEKSA